MSHGTSAVADRFLMKVSGMLDGPYNGFAILLRVQDALRKRSARPSCHTWQ